MAGAAALAAVLVGAAPAHASVASVQANRCCVWVQYDASPGEANRVTASVGQDSTGAWTWTISDPGAAVIQPQSQDPTSATGCFPAGVSRVICRENDYAPTSQFYLGDGNDTYAGSGLPAIAAIFGGDGDDRLQGGPGANVLVPGLGADQVIGAGRDLVEYRDHPARVHVSLDGVANDGMPGEGDDVTGVDQIEGSPYDDTLVGSDGPDRIYGYGGGDRIDGRGGDDDLSADGHDRVTGGPGRDTIRAFGGDNRIDATDGEVDTVDCGFWTGNTLAVDPVDVLQNCPA